MKISVALFSMEQTMLKRYASDLMGAAFEVYNLLDFGMAEEIEQQSPEI